MKILKVHIENINSLAGRWDIDFTDEEYTKNHGMFVITGPTGAGKTSVLDAITLALYGKTARQSVVNTAANEVMTRGKSLCRAVVEYVCTKGHYVSEWSQERGTRSGKLCSAQFRITRDGVLVDEGNTSPANVKADKLGNDTQNIIGLDYKQFSRSIMLAQGEFSKFLSSTADERVEILEKLDGSVKYREIGKRIYERAKEEEKKTQSLKDRLADLSRNIMSEEERAKALNDKIILGKEDEETSRALDNIAKRIEWKHKIEQCKKAYKDAVDALDATKTAQANAAPRKEALKKADSAAECESAYKVLCNAQDDAASDDAKLKDAKAHLLIAKDTSAKSLQEKNEAAHTADEAVKAQEESLPVIKAMRQADMDIRAALEKAQDAGQRERSARADAKTAQKLLDTQIAKDKDNKAAISRTAQYHEANKADGELREKIAQGSQLRDRMNEERQQVNNLTKQQSTAAQNALHTKESLDAAQHQLDDVIAERDKMVQGNAETVARELQKRLVPGKPCPVCGSLEHPACGELPQTKQPQTGTNDVLADMVQRLNNADAKIKSLQGSISQLSSDAAAFTAQSDALAEQIQSCNAQRDEDKNAFCAMFAPWKDGLKGMNPTQALDALKKRAESWQANEDALASLQKAQSGIEAAIEASRSALDEKQAALSDAEAKSADAAKVLDALKESRQSQFGSKVADEEERLFAQHVKDARAALDRAAERAAQAEQDVADLTGSITATEKSLETRKAAVEKAQKDFDAALESNGFVASPAQSAEKAFIQGRMMRERRETERQAIRNIENAVVRADSLVHNAKESLDNCQAQKHEAADEDAAESELQMMQSELKDKHAHINEQRGAVKTRLDMDDKYHEEAAALAAQCEVQEAINNKWQRMNKWAGDLKGTKLSKFVQNITFHTLLKAANRNLRLMSDRFSLVAKVNSDDVNSTGDKIDKGLMDFSVEDSNFECTGAVTNLSGGEKFMVSLALALGIADFARGRVRIDSLFLDEGFGTLDNTLLSRVIATLAMLQKDGKMLGIITHVEAVGDAIPQHIDVVPISDGKSRLFGAGVSGDIMR